MLKQEIEKAVKSGRLSHLVKIIKDSVGVRTSGTIYMVLGNEPGVNYSKKRRGQVCDEDRFINRYFFQLLA